MIGKEIVMARGVTAIQRRENDHCGLDGPGKVVLRRQVLGVRMEGICRAG